MGHTTRDDRHGTAVPTGNWTAAHARGRGAAPRALEALTDWAFDSPATGSLQRLELLHQVDNTASCRVADKTRYRLEGVLPAAPPAFPWKGTCTYAGGTPDLDRPPHPAPVPSNAALPASSRATGTRKGEQET